MRSPEEIARDFIFPGSRSDTAPRPDEGRSGYISTREIADLIRAAQAEAVEWCAAETNGAPNQRAAADILRAKAKERRRDGRTT